GATFGPDAVVGPLGYRWSGHNATDEPAYTEPVIYRTIREHPPVRDLFAAELIEAGLLTADEVKAMVSAAEEKVAGAHTRVKERSAQVVEAARPVMDVSPEPDIKTAVSADVLESLNRQLLSVPDGFAVNPKLLRQMERRRQPLAGRDIDWAQAEALAFASLVTGGVP